MAASRHITQEGIDLICCFEGFSPVAYQGKADKQGVLTIGYGHVIRAGESFPTGISMARGREILANDVRSAEGSVLRLISVPLSDGEFNALVSFTFNCGGGALQASTLRRKLNRGDREGAAFEFLKWDKSNGMVQRGLIRRRHAEMLMFRG